MFDGETCNHSGIEQLNRTRTLTPVTVQSNVDITIGSGRPILNNITRISLYFRRNRGLGQKTSKYLTHGELLVWGELTNLYTEI